MDGRYLTVSVAFSLFLAATTRAQTTIYVDDDASGANDGSSWWDAFPDLQDALGVAVSGDVIRVGMGEYRPTSGSDTTATFLIPDGVTIIGGY